MQNYGLVDFVVRVVVGGLEVRLDELSVQVVEHLLYDRAAWLNTLPDKSWFMVTRLLPSYLPLIWFL